MGRMHHYAMIITTLVLIFTVPLLMYIVHDHENERVNENVQEALVNASYDAIASTKISKGLVFGTQNQRDTALNTFYLSLASSYYSVMPLNNSTVIAYTPFVMLVDNNGVYVCYNSHYTDYIGEGTSSPTRTNAEAILADPSSKHIDFKYYVTPLTAYSEAHSDGSDTYVVQFYLSDYILVYKNGKLLAEGNYAHVLDILQHKYPEALSSLSFLNHEDDYLYERQMLVTNTIERLINKYLNEGVEGADDVGANTHNWQYKFVLPTAQQAWQNAISGPTIITFYHGPQFSTGNTQIAQVAFAGGELTKESKYYVTLDPTDTYHVTDVNGTYLYDEYGNPVTKHIMYYHANKNCPRLAGQQRATYNTMEEAARAGAYPCPDCIH